MSESERGAAKAYLLAVIAGGSLDPDTLLAAAKCFKCYSKKQHMMVQSYLLCQINSGAVPQEGINIIGEGDGEFIIGEGGEFIIGE